MMHVRSILAWAIIATISNAEYCSICGDGFHVGNPDGLVRVAVSDNSAPATLASISCGELQVAGLNGSIPNGRCAILMPLILDACDCQLSSAVMARNLVSSPSPAPTLSRAGVTPSSPTVSQSRKPSFPTRTTAAPTRAATSIGSPVVTMAPTVLRPHASGGPAVNGGTLAPFRPPAAPWVPAPSAPVAAPFGVWAPASAPIVPPTAIWAMPHSAPYNWQPVVPPVFQPPAGWRPTYSVLYTPVPAPPTNPADQSTAVVVGVVCGILVTIGLISLFAASQNQERNRARAAAEQRARQQRTGGTQPPTPSAPGPSIVTSAAAAARKQREALALERRPLVLEVLFPMQSPKEKNDPEQPVSVRSLKYDQKSKRYMFSDDALDAKSCSICLEDLEESHDDIVSGLCSHTYHRQCIMDWLKQPHNDCPNCRQPMWDKATYNLIDTSIMNHQQQKNSKNGVQVDEAEFNV